MAAICFDYKNCMSICDVLKCQKNIFGGISYGKRDDGRF